MNTNELTARLETLKNLEKQIKTREAEVRIEKVNKAYNDFMDKWGEDIEALKIVHKNGMFMRDNGNLHSYGEVTMNNIYLEFYFDRGDWHLNVKDVGGHYDNILWYKGTEPGSEESLNRYLLRISQADNRMPLLIKSAEEGIAYYESQLSERLAKLGGTK